MELISSVRSILGLSLLLIGVVIFLIEVFGVFHFKYVLNRMHAAALGDTMGLTCSLVGLMILSGFNFTSLKMLMVILFLWVSSPVSSHMLSRVEYVTNESLEKHCDLFDDPKKLEEAVAAEENVCEEGDIQ